MNVSCRIAVALGLWLSICCVPFVAAAELLFVGNVSYGDGNPSHFIPGGIPLFDAVTYSSLGAPIRAQGPKAFVVGPDGDRVYVLNQWDGGWSASLQSISLVTGAVITDLHFSIDFGGPIIGIAISPDEHYAYLSDDRPDLWRLDLSSGAMQRIAIAANGIALSPDGRSLYVAWYGTITVISTASLSQHIIFYSAAAATLVPSRDGKLLYVINTSDYGNISCGPTCTVPGNSVWVVDVATEQVVAKINNVGRGPFAGVLSPDGRLLYVANGGGTQSGGDSISVISTETHSLVKQFSALGHPVGLALSQDGNRLFVPTPLTSDSRIKNTVQVFDAHTGAVLQSLVTSQAPTAVAIAVADQNAFQPSQVVEYYHSDLDHYFVTQSPTEIADLDSGVHAGWQRTGAAFYAFRPASERLTPICRFYGLPSAGLDSHFYTADSNECDRVTAQFAGVWVKETNAAFELGVPSTDGTCAPGTIPVYRVWNRRTDSNHRYTTDRAVRDAMVANGYVAEGSGADIVAMCAPQKT